MATLNCDVLVIGGGHAGAEAAWAAARLGARTILVTQQRDAIGRMSCNPAIGGIGKGQIVREIDALGGLMGLVTDEAGIQFRMLNRGKGPAVWAPRAQADSRLYGQVLLRHLESSANLTIIEGCVETLVGEAGDSSARTQPDALLKSSGTHGRTQPDALLKSSGTDHEVSAGVGAARRIRGAVLGDGRVVACAAVVVAAGTFLRGLMHTGAETTPGGRIHEPAALGLSDALRALGLRLERLKTGTPPRVARDSIDFSRLVEQPGDAEPAPFSFMTRRIAQPQVCCWLTATNPAMHELIRANLHRAPLYTGQIESVGPRYCPSIETKIVRFPDKQRHQVFLEPEGRDSERIYVNGVSTSLPRDVQERMVTLIEGLEQARIVQWGYAIEYDFVPPEQIDATLMAKCVRGLFLAGQINGTSGYEEAAGQGVVAGINAARLASGQEPITVGRDEGYIGVMIDDLVTRGVTEPYRMFTSRAEHRMHLRYDNADARLTPVGRRVGLVDDERWAQFMRQSGTLESVLAALDRLRWEGRTIREWLRRPDEDGVRFAREFAELRPLMDDAQVAARVLIAVRYEGYIARQRRMIARFRDLEDRAIPADIDYECIPHLRREAVERWSAVRPRNVGQAARVSGIHPTDVTTLIVHLVAAERQR